MIIDLSKTDFTNDFFSTILPDGSTLALNIVDEKFAVNGQPECKIQCINIAVEDTEGNYISCPCIIGLGNDILQVNTEHKEYEGKVLTPENKDFCTIEIYE